MIKIIILLILTFYIEDAKSASSIKTVSVNAKEHRNIFDIQLKHEKEMRHCNKIEYIELNNINLRDNQNNIVQSNIINHISLHNSNLIQFPQNILDHSSALNCLNLSNNNINLYKDNQVYHPYLEVLDLSAQSVSVTDDINPDVEILDLDSKNTYEGLIFNSINMKLPNLLYLILSGNDISKLLWNFNLSFPKLIRLDLININAKQLDSNFFQKIPTSLSILHLENNYIRQLTLKDTAEIKNLYLDRNPINTLEITSNSLETLSLSDCFTNNISVMFDLPYLSKLDLSNNNLNDKTDISYKILQPLYSLNVLVLDYNKFLSIPILNNMQKLDELSLNYNRINYIQTNTFSNLISLKKLSLKGNEINNFDKNSFSTLEVLEYLDLSENKLNYLSLDWTEPLKKLKYINLNSNFFTTILDTGIYHLSSLKHLFVVNNTFRAVTTSEMNNLPNFITVYLA